MKIGFVSLGCSKNLVDTEMMIGLFKNNNYEITPKKELADIILINTCGFIKSAKQEAIDTILEMAEYKKTGKCKFLIVTGCMVQRYKQELEKELPEVDLFMKIDEYDTLLAQTEKLVNSKKANCSDILEYENRVISTGTLTAYLKIAEGCSNRCTYCAIPSIRGPYVSRPMEDILQEAKILAEKGIKEIIVIAQDTTKYGIDLYKKPMLAKLLSELAKINELKWIRFLYAYPESITDELIDVVKNNDKICKYFDIPLQHYSDNVLKRMNRKSNSTSINNLIKNIRKSIPNVIIRTTVMVGFPGESEKDFEQLYNFLQEAKFDKLGAFIYSKEDGTPAYKLDGQVDYKTKKSRYNKIMSLQKKISKQKLKEHKGKTYTVMIEGLTQDNEYYITRSYMDVPEIDGVIYVKNNFQAKQDFIDCIITDTNEYDLIGNAIIHKHNNINMKK